MTSPAQVARDFAVFELQGKRHYFNQDMNQTIARLESTTREFSVEEGLMLVRADHKGAGEFKVELARVRPGFLGGDESLFQCKGPYSREMAWVIVSGGRRAPRPREKYQLKVTSTGQWAIEILQPDLGQAQASVPYRISGQRGGTHLIGPIRVSSRPLLARARHSARGEFYAHSLPLDGDHEAEEFIEATGQTLLEDLPTKMRPGKEYIIEIGSGGNWELELYEGY